MGCSSSKPSKPPRKSNKSTPLSYPYLEPLPLPPLPHHPNSSRPDPYQELAGRYGRILADNPIYAGTKKVEAGGAYRAQAARAPAPTQQARSKQHLPKAKAAYQFRPLGEIGRAPAGQGKGGAKVQVKPQPQPQTQLYRQEATARPKAAYQFKPLNEIGRAANPAKVRAQAKAQPLNKHTYEVKAPYQFKPLSDIGASRAGKKGAKNDVLPPIAPLKINYNTHNNNNNNNRSVAAAAVGKYPDARFGATRQDGHGEWWVLVLADGQWHRSREMGLEPPGWF